MSIGKDRAYVSIPLDIQPLAAQLQQVHRYTKLLSQTCQNLNTASQASRDCLALSYAADFSYSRMNSKFETTAFFLTRNQNYGYSEVFNNLTKRQDKKVDEIFSQNAFNTSPNFIRQNLDIGSRQPYSRRTILTEDDTQLNDTKVELEIPESVDDEDAAEAEAEAEAEADAGGDEEETSEEPQVIVAPLGLGNLSTTDIDLSGEIEEEEDKAEVNPLDTGPTPYDPLANTLINQADSYSKERTFGNNRIKRQAEGKQSFDIEKGVYSRLKRQIISAVVGLLGAIGVSSIFGGINTAQIDSIQKQESRLGNRQGLIVHELHKDSLDILVNRNMLKGLEQLTFTLAKFEKEEHFETLGLSLYVMMTAELSRIDDSLNQFIAINSASQNGKFHPAILSQDSATSAFEAVKAKAELRGLQPIINAPQQLSQLRTHFDFAETGIKIIIEIPLVSVQNTFELHRFDALPIELGAEAYLTLISDFPIIGIGKSDVNGKPTFVELSYTDMADCQKIGEVLLCPDKKVVKRPYAQSCIYSLYLADFEQAQHVCRISLKGKERDQAVPVGPSDFALYSSHPTHYRYVCANNSVSQPQQIQGITEIHVPEACVAETAQFLLHGQNQIHDEAHHRSLLWTYPALSLLANDTSLGDVNDALRAYKQSKAIPELDAESVETFKQLNTPLYEDPVPFTAISLASLAVVIILGGLSIVVFRNYRARQKYAREQSPKFRANELLSDGTNVAFLEQLLLTKRNV